MNAGRWKWMEEQLEQLKLNSQYRSLSETSMLDNGWMMREGRKMLNLASNHYLGLPVNIPYTELQSDEGLLHSDLSEGMQSGLSERHGLSMGMQFGSAASRLVVGNDPVYQEFEGQFAAFKGTENSLVFGSGYMANIGIISALVGRNDVVFSDRLNHASIIDGITLSRAEHQRYRHRDLDHLESMLRKTNSTGKKLIVTDTIFSMDGSIAPLKELVQLKERYGAMLMVDEAHSGGVYGAQGEGLTHALGLTGQVDIQMGTFSKAYGCYGAYVAGDSILIQYLVNKARSFIFTTALPPVIIQAIRHNWRKVKSEDWRRDEVIRKSAWFHKSLQHLGFNTGSSDSHIVPLIVGDNDTTVKFSHDLQEQGIAAVAIRPPTVPEGSARIRFTLMATHRQEDLEWALSMMESTGKRYGII